MFKFLEKLKLKKDKPKEKTIKERLDEGELIPVGRDDLSYFHTKELVEKAERDNLIILVGNQQSIDTLSGYGTGVTILGIAPMFTKHLLKREERDVLIHESVSKESLEFLQQNNFRFKGGFIYAD